MTHTPFVRGIPVDNLYEDQDILMQTEVLFFSPCGARPL